MTPPVVLLAGLTVAAAAPCCRHHRRWRHIHARPVVTCRQPAALPMRQAVAVTGRTRDGPLVRAPYSGRDCIGYRAEVGYHREIGQNDLESVVERKRREGIPVPITDDTGAISVAEQLAGRSLARKRDAVLGRMIVYQQTTNAHDGKRSYHTTETVVPASATVLVTGVTTRDTDGTPMLIRDGWIDGAAIGTLPEVSRRVNHRIRLFAAISIGCTVLATVLIGSRMAGIPVG
jgi:hypothetical protein